MPESEIWRPDQLGAIFDVSDNGPNTRHYIRCWQLDAPDAILADPQVRLAAYRMAKQYAMLVVAFNKQEPSKRSAHIIPGIQDLWVPLLMLPSNRLNWSPTWPLYELIEDVNPSAVRLG